jgi:polar amino acid transport system substrate-binding protein
LSPAQGRAQTTLIRDEGQARRLDSPLLQSKLAQFQDVCSTEKSGFTGPTQLKMARAEMFQIKSYAARSIDLMQAMLCLIVLFLLFGGMGTAHAVDLTLLTEEGPPHNMAGDQPGQIIGMGTELVEKALQSAGLSYKIVLASWRRAYQTALTEANTCVYSTTLTDDRKSSFVWIGPLYNNEWVLIMKEGQKAPLSINQLKGSIIGGYYGDATTDFLQSQGLTVDQTSNDTLNIRKLDAGRVDYWVVSRERFRYLKRKTGIQGLIESIKIKDAVLYLACNKSIAPDIANRLNAAIKRFHDDGTADAIRLKYE